MPATSKSQQRLMAMAYEVKKFKDTGKGLDPLDIKPEYRVEVEDLSASMTLKQLKDFAETKHKNLPEKKIKESGLTGFLSAGPFPHVHTYASQSSISSFAMSRDKRDPMVQNFIDYIDGKEKKKKLKSNLQEAVVGLPGVATPVNTPGMGNAVPPSQGNVGSGDTFTDEPDKKVGLLSYEDYKKWLKKWQKQNQAGKANLS